MAERKNLFISHIHEDDSKLTDLKSLLANSGLEVRDSSINSSNPNNAQDHDYIKQKILAPQIDWASTLVVYVSPGTKDSSWVNWEIEYAAMQGKRIVGVWERGDAGCELPAALDEYHDALVGWHGDSIVNAIVSDHDSSENPDGSPRPSVPLKRHPCW
ncbi:MAG: TIR domain-containing protein [Vicinamibacterales bacterium]